MIKQKREYGPLCIDSIENTTGTILGMLDSRGKKTVSIPNKNIIAFATQYKRKFLLDMLAQICIRHESVVVSDPTGELYKETGDWFRNFGYTVKCINFKDIAYSDNWNPMSELGPRDDAAGSQERASLFANAVVSNAMPNTSGLFRDGSLNLLIAVLLRVHLDPMMPDSIDEVIRIINNPAGVDYLDQIFDENMLQGDLKCCLGYYSVFKSGSARLSCNILTGLATALIPFQIERVRMVMSHDGSDLMLPGEKPCAYYFLFPDQNEDYKFLIALLFTFVLNDLRSYADAQPNWRCRVPVTVVLDEFAGPVFNLYEYFLRISMHKWNIHAVYVFQSLITMQSLYHDSRNGIPEWEGILDNSTAHIVYDVADAETAMYFSNMARFGDPSDSHKLTVDEILRMKREDCIIMAQGQCSLYCHKSPFELHPI